MKHFTALFALLLLTACAGGGSSAEGGTEPGGADAGAADTVLSSCRDPRPLACTREFRPVCAVLGSGQLATYDNPCTACADEAVTGHYPDACASPGMSACGEPRPQVCTLDYRPVCGQLTSGETRTYGNACMACGDRAVIGSFEGECP